MIPSYRRGVELKALDVKIAGNQRPCRLPLHRQFLGIPVDELLCTTGEDQNVADHRIGENDPDNSSNETDFGFWCCHYGTADAGGMYYLRNSPL